MNVLKLNGVKVYNLTSNRSLPEWASRAEKKRQFAQDPGLAKHIELIQELEMPDSATFLTVTPDDQYLFALGRYKPRVKCYELANLALKFDRCVDYLPYRMQLLSDDYSKFALLEEERWVDVHAVAGHFFKFRIPHPGVDLAYSPFSCDLFLASSKSSIYRMNLYEGRFNTPLVNENLLETSHGFTSCAYGLEHGLLFGASSLGRLDGWDTRTGEHVLGMNVSGYSPAPDDLVDTKTGKRHSPTGVTCVKLKDPINVAVGTADGMVYIYDIRQNRVPLHSRDTEFRQPIKTIDFHEDKVIALLPNCVKIWYLDTGKIFVGFDTGRLTCNWMHHFHDSGLFMVAMESPKIATYFIPLLGPAAAWCSHLDQLVLECEPDVTTMYDGYKFLTRQQLAELGMLELIGTQFLRAYMHGYFVSTRLYNKVRERLGISTEQRPLPEKVITDKTISATTTPNFSVEEFNQACDDSRFSKLKHNPKLSVNPNDTDSDLIRIHQSRLLKKRKRKAVRQERAARAHSLTEHALDT